MDERTAMDAMRTVATLAGQLLEEVNREMDVAHDQLQSLGWSPESVTVETSNDGAVASWLFGLALDAAAYVAWGRRKLAVFEVRIMAHGSKLIVLPTWLVAREVLPRPTLR